MTHTSSSPQPTVSVHALTDVLPLPLQHTLNNLTVNLDQELTRYRQQKQGITPQQQPVFRPRPRPLSLIDVKSQSSIEQPTARVAPPPPPKNPKLNRTASADPAAASEVGGALATQSGAVPETSETYLASSAALLDSLAADTHTTGSSTADLREAPQPEAAWTHILGTPLGMGGLLLLLIASAGLGYALVNPVVIQHLATQTPIGRWLGADSHETDPSEADPLSADQPEQELALRQPDLSQSEFTDLNLSRLSTLPNDAGRPIESDVTAAANSTPTTSAVPKAVTTPTTTNTETAATAPTPATTPAAAPETAAAPQRPASPARPVEPVAATTLPAIPATATPAPTQAAEPINQPAPPVSAAAPSSETHYVITDYRGDPSLAEVRQVVGDAYVHNFPIGARIQLGVYDTAADAEADAAALQNQGISATVYSP
jgi:hypothetical protein